MDFDDIIKIVDQVKVLEARLAAVEAERDAATKKAEQLLLSRYFTRCREGAFDHSTDCATWGDDGQGNVDGKPVHPPCNCGASWNWAKQMEAERDAARAGKARAVEALWKYRSAQRRMLDKWADGDNAVKTELWRGLHDCEKLADAVLCQAQPALDWLAQQRREAAAEAMGSFADYLNQHTLPPRPGIVRLARIKAKETRAAALRAGAGGGVDASL